MPSKEEPQFVLSDLFTTISQIFDQAQTTLANHRKNCVTLCKLHLQAARIKQKVKSTSADDDDGNGDRVKLVGEKAFGDVFVDMVNRVLVVKKGGGTGSADRVVKFVGAYVKFVNEKGARLLLRLGTRDANSSSCSWLL